MTNQPWSPDNGATAATPPKKSHKLAWILAFVGAVVLLCLVGGIIAAATSGDPKPTVQPPTTSSANGSTTVTTAPTKPARAVAAQTTNLKLGSVVTLPATSGVPPVTVSALKYKHGALYGTGYDAVEARVCIGKSADADPNGYPVSSDPWSLIFNKGESRFSDLASGLTPEYPSYDPRITRPGQCVRGWINFGDAPGTPEGIEYVNDEFTASWSFK